MGSSQSAAVASPPPSRTDQQTSLDPTPAVATPAAPPPSCPHKNMSGGWFYRNLCPHAGKKQSEGASSTAGEATTPTGSSCPVHPASASSSVPQTATEARGARLNKALLASDCPMHAEHQASHGHGSENEKRTLSDEINPRNQMPFMANHALPSDSICLRFFLDFGSSSCLS